VSTPSACQRDQHFLFDGKRDSLEHSQPPAAKLTKFLSRTINPVSARRNYAEFAPVRRNSAGDLTDRGCNNIQYTRSCTYQRLLRFAFAVGDICIGRYVLYTPSLHSTGRFLCGWRKMVGKTYANAMRSRKVFLFTSKLT